MAHPPEQIAFSGNMGIVATMSDGRIVTLVTEGEERLSKKHLTQDNPSIWVYMRASDDGGRTWTEPEKAYAHPAGKGYAGAPLPLVDRDDRIHAFSMRFYGLAQYTGDWRCVLQHTVSEDGGRTWSAIKDVDFGARYTGALNNAIQMDGGRILVPLSYLDEERADGLFVSRVVYSDDGGETWGISNDCPVGGGGDFIESGSIEPVVVQFPSGMVWMVIRTTLGYFWESFSNDGAIWTPPQPTRIVASNAPGGVLRLADGRIVLIWNNIYGEPFRHGHISYARHTLHGAISNDEAQTWSPPKVVGQRRPDEGISTMLRYPFLCQASDGAVVLSHDRTSIPPDSEERTFSQELWRIDPEWLAG